MRCPRGAALPAGGARALDPSTSLSQYGLDAWQDGLPQNSIHAILQTREGYLWFGTYEGLVRFNGVSFVVYDTRNTAALKSNSAWALLEDRLGTLWVGTLGGGVVRSRGGVFTRYGVREGLPSEYASALCEDAGGTLWAGTDQGLARFDGTTFRAVALPGSPERPSIRSLLADPAGGLWIGTASEGLLRWDGKAVRRIYPKEGRAPGAVYSLAPSPGGVAAAFYGLGLVETGEDGTVRIRGKKDGLQSDLLWSLHRDRNGALWVGSDGAGLARISEGRIETFGVARRALSPLRPLDRRGPRGERLDRDERWTEPAFATGRSSSTEFARGSPTKTSAPSRGRPTGGSGSGPTPAASRRSGGTVRRPARGRGAPRGAHPIPRGGAAERPLDRDERRRAHPTLGREADPLHEEGRSPVAHRLRGDARREGGRLGRDVRSGRGAVGRAELHRDPTAPAGCPAT